MVLFLRFNCPIMDISKINNSKIFTEAFSKGIDKYYTPNLKSFSNAESQSFGKILDKKLITINGLKSQRLNTSTFMPKRNISVPKDMNVTRHLPDMRMQNANYIKLPKSSVLRQYTVYKEDQLLSNPGGDNFFLNKSSGVIDNNYDHSRFSKRIGKD
ncbi:MAG: hypothetical protein ACE5KZ_13095, partial [Candidatus Scalinduaceae bacterium]